MANAPPGKWCGRDARVPGWASSTQQTGNMIYTTPRNRARGRLQGAKKPKAPLPFHPSGAVGQGCAGRMCGRDARVPGWASSTQLTGNLIYVTPRIGAKRRLQGPKRPTAPLPVGAGGAVGQGCAGKMVRAGRPRSRVGILHTTDRGHDLHHAQDWGKTPFARPKETHGPVTVPSRRRRWPRLRQAMCGRDARVPGWWSVSGTLPAGSRPAGLQPAGAGPFLDTPGRWK